MASCQDDAAGGRYQSPTSKLFNRLLWGNPDEGDTGLIVRTSDHIDPCDGSIRYGSATWRYIPASFLHASIRPPHAVFSNGGNLRGFGAVTGRVFGTSYDKNWSMRRLQRHGNVSCPTYFPGDGGTFKRNSFRRADGGGCRPGQGGLCFNGTCLVNRTANCQCDYAVPPYQFGEHYAGYMGGRKSLGVTKVSCWYPGTDQGVQDVVEAQNSLWRTANVWSTRRKSPGYEGHNEVMATRTILQLEMADAIFISVSVPHRNASLCDYAHEALNGGILSGIKGERSLEQCYSNYTPHSVLPIVFYTETLGISDPDECHQVWGGEDCDSGGYRKEFFSQRLNFSDGSCLASPPGCDDAYYFPRDNSTGLCSAYVGGREVDEICSSRERRIASVSTESAKSLKGISEVNWTQPSFRLMHDVMPCN